MAANPSSTRPDDGQGAAFGEVAAHGITFVRLEKL
jgi:hypothetical protein